MPALEASFAGLLSGWVVNPKEGCAPFRASGTDSRLRLCQRESRLLVSLAVPSRWQNLSAQEVATHPAAHPVLGVSRARSRPRVGFWRSPWLQRSPLVLAQPARSSAFKGGRTSEQTLASGAEIRAGSLDALTTVAVFEPQGPEQRARLFHPASGVDAVSASGRIPLRGWCWCRVLLRRTLRTRTVPSRNPRWSARRSSCRPSSRSPLPGLRSAFQENRTPSRFRSRRPPQPCLLG